MFRSPFLFLLSVSSGVTFSSRCLSCACSFCWYPLLGTCLCCRPWQCSKTVQGEPGSLPPLTWQLWPCSHSSLVLGLGHPLVAWAIRPDITWPWQAHQLSLPALFFFLLENNNFQDFFHTHRGIGWGLSRNIVLGPSFCLDLLFYQFLLWWPC